MEQRVRWLTIVVLISSCAAVLNGQGVTRTIVVEMFTNSGCPPCKPANDYFDAWLATFAQKNQVAVVKYHAWWPDPNDPFYLVNTQQAIDRNTFYANNYVPHVWIDGSIDGEYIYSSWPLQIQNRLAVASPLTLGISSNVGTSGGTATITVGCPGAVPSGTLVLHTVIAESNIYYAGGNGETMHEDVMRKMLPGTSGEEFVISTGETKTFSRSITWNSNWVLSNSHIVVFVQSKTSKEVIQAAVLRADGTVTAVGRETASPTGLVLSQNYPNPFNPSTMISFTLPTKTFVSLKIFDALGREVSVLLSEELPAGTYSQRWYATDLISGVYFYRLEAGSFNETKKLLLLR